MWGTSSPQVLLSALVLPQARQDVQQLKSIAGTASRKLGDMASSFMRDLQGGGY